MFPESYLLIPYISKTGSNSFH